MQLHSLGKCILNIQKILMDVIIAAMNVIPGN